MKNVLLVGSDFMPEDGLHRLLTVAGYKVTTVADSHAMLFLMATGMPIDLVIIDDCAPSAKTNEVLRSARLAARHVPIIVLTSESSILEYLRALSLGVYDYMHKPVPAYEIMRIVHAATGASKNNTVQAIS